MPDGSTLYTATEEARSAPAVQRSKRSLLPLIFLLALLGLGLSALISILKFSLVGDWGLSLPEVLLTGGVLSVAAGLFAYRYARVSLQKILKRWLAALAKGDLSVSPPVEVSAIAQHFESRVSQIEAGIQALEAERGAAAQREEQTYLLLNTLPEAILHIQRDLLVIGYNEAALAVLGRQPDDFATLRLTDLIGVMDRQTLQTKLFSIAKGASTTSVVFDVELAPPAKKQLYGMVITKLPEGSYSVVLKDLANSRKTQDQLRLSEERLRFAIKATHCGVWDYNMADGVFWWSKEFLQILGYSEGEIEASLDAKYKLIHEEDIAWVKSSAERFLKRDVADYNPEYRILRKDGSWMWVEERATAEWNEAGAAIRFSGTMTDCSERKRFEKQLMYMATHDPLTDLPNRTLLLDRLDHGLSAANRNGLKVAVLQLNIDRFKLINESLGHEAGDQLVRAISLRLQQSLRPMDTLARLSGDEFVIICEDLPSPQEAARVAKRLLNALSQHFLVDGNQMNVSMSIGISVSPLDGNTSQQLLRHADTAMHSAKASGGHTYRFFIAEMNKEVVSRMTLERHLQEAVERQQFILHYQPKIDIASGQMTGVEALIRWPHRTLGNVSPARFIPIAEETGSILAIGEWVLRETLSQINVWRDAGFEPPQVAVNLSGKQLMTGGIDELILRLLREYNVSPQLLEIEITESTVMTNMDKLLPVLKHLRDAGIGVAMDDFGTGYSSLSYLRQMPITSLKIDRSFVKDVPMKQDANAIASIILEIGHQLGLKVVAEGIETEEQLAFLKEHNCDVAQGWLFHKAMSADKLKALLKPRSAA